MADSWPWPSSQRGPVTTMLYPGIHGTEKLSDVGPTVSIIKGWDVVETTVDFESKISDFMV